MESGRIRDPKAIFVGLAEPVLLTESRPHLVEAGGQRFLKSSREAGDLVAIYRQGGGCEDSTRR